MSVEKHSEGQTILFHVSYELTGLANAFRLTGNAAVARQLETIAEDILRSKSMMAEAYGEELARQVSFAGSLIGETLSSVMTQS